MSKEKQANVDTKGLGRFMGIWAYVNGGVLIAAGVLSALDVNQVIVPAVAFSFFIVSTGFFLIRAQKFDGNVYDQQGKPRPGAWKQMSAPVGIVAVTLVFVAGLLFFATRPTQVTFLDDGMQIHGMYGQVYAWDSIEDVQLLDELPTIQRRTNGSAVGPYLRGYFMTKELGSVKLVVHADKPPFIRLTTEGGTVIFNMHNADETRDVFEEIGHRKK